MKKVLAALLAAAAVLTMSGCIDKNAVLELQTNEPEQTSTEEVTTEEVTTEPEPEPIPEEILGQWYVDADATVEYMVELGYIDSSEASAYRTQLTKLQASVTLSADGTYTSVSVDLNEGGADIVTGNFSANSDGTLTIIEPDGRENVCTYRFEGEYLVLDADEEHLVLTKTEPVYIPEELIGKWYVDVDATVEYFVSEGLIDEDDADKLRDDLEFQNGAVMFSENGTYQTISTDDDGDIDTDEGTFSVSGDELTLDGDTVYTYEISGGKLTMEMGGVGLVFAKQDETENGGLTAAAIAGTWEIDRAMSLSLAENLENYDDVTDNINLFADCKLTFVFTANGKVTQITVENGTTFTSEGTFTIETIVGDTYINMAGDSGSGKTHKIYFKGDQLVLENDAFIVALDKTASAGTASASDDELTGTWKMDPEGLLALLGDMEDEEAAISGALMAMMEVTMVFGADGTSEITMVAMDETETQKGTYTADGTTLTITAEDGTITTFAYRFDGDTLYLENEGVELPFVRG